MTIQADDFWDLDLRIQPAHERPLPMEMTVGTTNSRRPTCPSTDPENCQTVSITCWAYDAFR
jgi:hypothetical protein